MSKPKKLKRGSINLCTVNAYIGAEVKNDKALVLEFSCVKDGYNVQVCRYFKPLKCAGDLMCHNECGWFNAGCTCKRARQYALRRATKILKNNLLSTDVYI